MHPALVGEVLETNLKRMGTERRNRTLRQELASHSSHLSLATSENPAEQPSPEKFIAAPWGNWLHPQGTIPVMGTFTLQPRGNRFWRVLRTLRYRRSLGGWTNNLGLPNPGIAVGLQKFNPELAQVLSVAEIEHGDYKKLAREIPEDFPVELNLSCPNLEKTLPWDDAEMFTRSCHKRKWCIAKVGPLVRPEELEFLIEKLGFSQIHACNSLRVTVPHNLGGSVSGPILVPYVLEIIELVRQHWPEVTVIAGGGIKNSQDVYRYLSAGAKHVSLGTVCFNPFKLNKLLRENEY